MHHEIFILSKNCLPHIFDIWVKPDNLVHIKWVKLDYLIHIKWVKYKNINRLMITSSENLLKIKIITIFLSFLYYFIKNINNIIKHFFLILNYFNVSIGKLHKYHIFFLRVGVTISNQFMLQNRIFYHPYKSLFDHIDL